MFSYKTQSMHMHKINVSIYAANVMQSYRFISGWIQKNKTRHRLSKWQVTASSYSPIWKSHISNK